MPVSPHDYNVCRSVHDEARGTAICWRRSAIPHVHTRKCNEFTALYATNWKPAPPRPCFMCGNREKSGMADCLERTTCKLRLDMHMRPLAYIEVFPLLCRFTTKRKPAKFEVLFALILDCLPTLCFTNLGISEGMVSERRRRHDCFEICGGAPP
jgi:hypothetical protein